MILISVKFKRKLNLLSPRHFRISSISCSFRMNDANIMSTFCSIPNKRSLLSFSEMAGRSTSIPGKLIPFRLPKIPPFSTWQSTYVLNWTLIYSRSNFQKNLLISLQNLQRNEPIVHIDWVTWLDNLGKISIIDIDFKLISIFQIIWIQRQTEFITLKILSPIICHKFTLTERGHGLTRPF